MTRDEIVTALRCCGNCDVDECKSCPLLADAACQIKLTHDAADLIENQQRHIEALLQANAGLRDTVLRRDEQIKKMKEENNGQADNG